MTAEQLVAAMRDRARRAPTSEAERLLRMAAELERTPAQTTFQAKRRRGPRVVTFRAGGKTYREKSARERRRGMGLAGI